MWLIFVLGLAAVAVYEFTQSQPGVLDTSAVQSLVNAFTSADDGTGSGDNMDGITNDPGTWPSGDQVWQVCCAIAHAEGADVAGAAPDRYNNPGDLSKGDEYGQGVVGYVTLPDGENIIEFETKAGGWQALYTKINHIRLDVSLAYSPSMTWNQIAAKYAGDSASWVRNVTNQLGVSPTDTFGSYFS